MRVGEGLWIKALDDGGAKRLVAPRRGAVSSARKNMFVQEDDGNRGEIIPALLPR